MVTSGSSLCILRALKSTPVIFSRRVRNRFFRNAVIIAVRQSDGARSLGNAITLRTGVFIATGGDSPDVQEPQMSETVAGALVDVLEKIGVRGKTMTNHESITPARRRPAP